MDKLKIKIIEQVEDKGFIYRPNEDAFAYFLLSRVVFRITFEAVLVLYDEGKLFQHLEEIKIHVRNRLKGKLNTIIGSTNVEEAEKEIEDIINLLETYE